MFVTVYVRTMPGLKETALVLASESVARFSIKTSLFSVTDVQESDVRTEDFASGLPPRLRFSALPR